MERGVRKLLFNRCMPYEALEPGDDRNVDIDAVETDGRRVRGVSWVGRLAERVELAATPALLLFTGLPGSGKSTELRRLAARLGATGGADLLPVVIDARDALDLTAPVDIPDVLAAVVSSCELAVLQLEGLTEEQAQARASADGYLTRLWSWLVSTDIELTRGELAVSSAAKLVVELKTRPTLRQKVRAVVAAHLRPFLAGVDAELRALEARVQARHKAGLVVIFDSLEQLRGVSTNWTQVLTSAEQIFAGGAPYLRLPVHAIYTVPPALVARRVERVEFMPMLKLAARDGVEYAPGYAVARQLVRQRVPDENLSELLGPDAEARIARIIRWSGGYPRDIVRSLQELILAEHHPLRESDLDRILNEVRDSYLMMVPGEAFPWLARVAVDQRLTIQDEAHRPAADLMLSSNVVLRYLNDEGWFDLHPAVKENPGIQLAIRDYRAALARGAASALEPLPAVATDG